MQPVPPQDTRQLRPGRRIWVTNPHGSVGRSLAGLPEGTTRFRAPRCVVGRKWPLDLVDDRHFRDKGTRRSIGRDRSRRPGAPNPDRHDGLIEVARHRQWRVSATPMIRSSERSLATQSNPHDVVARSGAAPDCMHQVAHRVTPLELMLMSMRPSPPRAAQARFAVSSAQASIVISDGSRCACTQELRHGVAGLPLPHGGGRRRRGCPDGMIPDVTASGRDMVPLPPGHKYKIVVTNDTDRPLFFVVEDRNWARDALIGEQRVKAMPAFRQLCPEQLLRPGDDVEIGRVAIVFTDLQGSTKLYDALGDATASFHLVGGSRQKRCMPTSALRLPPTSRSTSVIHAVRGGAPNENTNRLLRQYFPRGINLSRVSPSYLHATALMLNQRWRRAGTIPPWSTTIRSTPVLFFLSSAREMAAALCPFLHRSHSSGLLRRREPNS
jgi:hypothetical protein